MYHPFALSARVRCRTPVPAERLLSLSLLVLRITTTDHTHDAAAPDDLAVFANPFHAGTHFHDDFRSFRSFARQLYKVIAVRFRINVKVYLNR
jgi:hypothetical protein